jgi:two-component system, sporulation sensor kinase A
MPPTCPASKCSRCACYPAPSWRWCRCLVWRRWLAVQVDTYILILATVVLLLAYLITRSGDYRLGALVVTINISIGLQMIALPDAYTSLSESNTLYYVNAAVMMASIFLSSREVLLLALGNGLGMLLLPIITPFYTYAFVLGGPLIMLTLFTLLILNATRQRNRLEAFRIQTMDEKEARYRLLAENANDIITTMDATGRICYISPACQPILGYTPAEMEGRALIEWVHEEDRPLFNTVPQTQNSHTLTYRMLRRDGTLAWIEATTRALTDSQHDERVQAVLRDVTRRQQVADALRTSENKYRALIEQAGDAILVTDRAHHVIEANRRAYRLFGYSREELLALKLNDLLAFEHSTADPDDSATMISERTALHKNGKQVSVEISAKPLEDGRFFISLRDTTERHQSEQQRLELAVERERVAILQRFISDASHDLRTPLTVIKTSIYVINRLLAEQVKAMPKLQEHMTAMNEQIARIEKLLNDLLTMARLDRAGQEEFSFQWCELNNLMEDVNRSVKREAQRKLHHIETDYDESVGMQRVDAKALARAVQNMLQNAISYTAEGGKIRLSTRKIEDQVEITVQDNGIGIHTDDLPHIFERFYRADKARRMEGGGMGLGLSIAKRIIEAHGGQIVANSTPQGSTFSIRLPDSGKR